LPPQNYWGLSHGQLRGIARFLIEKLGRFSTFKGRDLNSRFAMEATYRRMLRIFEPMRAALIGRSLNAAQIAEILQTKRIKEPAENAGAADAS